MVEQSGRWSCAAEGELTDGGEDAGEAEVVNSVEREQVEEELLLLLLAAQEGVTLVQLPVGKPQPGQVQIQDVIIICCSASSFCLKSCVSWLIICVLTWLKLVGTAAV